MNSPRFLPKWCRRQVVGAVALLLLGCGKPAANTPLPRAVPGCRFDGWMQYSDARGKVLTGMTFEPPADDETVRQVRELGAVAYLVKPLDIGQIVPTDEAAFANLGARAAAVAAPRPQQAVNDAVADTVALALGVLMHRYSLQRGAAYERLLKLAAEDGRSVADQAERLVEAVELLARGQ